MGEGVAAPREGDSALFHIAASANNAPSPPTEPRTVPSRLVISDIDFGRIPRAASLRYDRYAMLKGEEKNCLPNINVVKDNVHSQKR